MVKTKSKFFVYLVCLSILLAISFLLSSTTIITSNASLMMTNNFSDKITVTAYDSQNQSQTTSATPISLTTPAGETLADYSSYSFPWSKVAKFEVNIDTSALPDAESYNYTYYATWSPASINGGKANFQTAHTYQKELFTESVSSKEQITSQLNFFVEEPEQQTKTNQYVGKNVFGTPYEEYGGWGIYMFTFELNGQMQSAVYELVPTDVNSIPQKPILSHEIQQSNVGLKNAYLFSVDEAYKYVNGYQINWYVTGKAQDGRIYVLLPSDITNEEVENSIYDADSESLRTGHTFLFDPPIEGSWTITCKILDTDLKTVVYTSTSEQLSTVEGFDGMTIVYIVIGAAAAAAIIVAIVIIVKIKKEKVY